MTVRTNRGIGTGTRIGRAALAVGVVLAAGGCSTYRPFYKPSTPGTYQFKITFSGACPESAMADFLNCPPKNGAAPKDCVRVKRLDSVKFYADPATAPANAAFVLVFDPFGKAPIEVQGEVTLTTEKVPNPDPDADPKAKLEKFFTFVVKGTSPSCKVIDPQLILD